MQPSTQSLVLVTIAFEQHVTRLSNATAVVRLVDESYADASANVVAEVVQQHLTLDPQRDPPVQISLSCPVPDPRAHYAVQAHIDLDGDMVVSMGDFINMQSYPVLTFGHPREVTVLVRQVG
jgi:hypothetical protein